MSDDRHDLYDRCAEVLLYATALQAAIYEVLDENGVTKMSDVALGIVIDKLTRMVSELRSERHAR